MYHIMRHYHVTIMYHIMRHYHTSLSYVTIMRHYHTSLSYVTIMRHYHTSLSYVTIMRRYHTSLSYVTIMRHYHASLSYITIIRHYHASLSYITIIRHYHTSLSCVTIIRHYHMPLSYLTIIHHYHTSLSCVTIIRHYHTSLSYLTIMRHYHTSLSYVAIIPHYHASLSYLTIMRHYHTSLSYDIYHLYSFSLFHPFQLAPGTYQSVRVKVVYPYEAVLEDELNLIPGDIIHVEEQLGDWWRGRNRNHCKSGLFYKDFTVPYCPEEEESPCEWLGADDKPRNPVGFPVTFMEREYRAQSRPGDELECMICNSLSNNPHQTGCCGHTVCYNCAAQWRRRNNSCPNCRRMPLELAVDPRTKRHILSLTVYCPHYEIGCDWIGSFSNASNHLQHHCLLEVVKCEHKGCSRMLQRKDLNDHMREKCLMRPVKCPCCDLGSGREKSRDWDDGWLVGIVRTVSSLFVPSLTYDRLVGHHYRECEKWPLRCPNRCNTKERLTRSTVNAHLKDNCPEQVISCQFAEAGCTARVKRKEMADHIQQSVGEHMTAMMSDYIKVKKELRQLKNEYSDLKQDHERLKDHVGRVEKTKSTSYFYN